MTRPKIDRMRRRAGGTEPYDQDASVQAAVDSWIAASHGGEE